MFRPRHAYRSPITNRYKGKAHGCPVFNNLNKISSDIVEQHDECLECLATIKNHKELYRSLLENSRPSNNVIRSLQKLSSSSTDNRLKMCLQLLTIKVNESNQPKDNVVETNNVETHHIETPPRSGTTTRIDTNGLDTHHHHHNNHNQHNHKNNHHNHQHHLDVDMHQVNSNNDTNGNGNVSSSSPPSFLEKERLTLSDRKIKKIQKRPLIFDDLRGHESATKSPMRTGINLFRSAPIFVNNLNLKTTPIAPTNGNANSTRRQEELGQELLKCAICSIQQRPPMIIKIYGQNSCRICSDFFEAFMEWPKQFYCAQDGDCLMTFDSRCRACWIKICLQKFDTDEEYRKIGHKYSPKLLSSPNVSLITIDTSLSNGSPMSTDQPCSTTSRTTPSTLSPGPQSLLMVASSSPAPGSVGITTKKKVKTKKKSKSKRLISLKAEHNNNMKQTSIGFKSINSKKKKTKSSNNKINNMINDDKTQQLKTNCISIQTDPVIDGPVALY